MSIKVCLLSIVAFLIGVLTTQRAQQIVHAQARIEYKVVQTEVSISDGGGPVFGRFKFFSTQDALDQYSKEGWELVTAFYDRNGHGRLILRRK